MPNPCRQRSFWARIKLSEKIIFITHFAVRDLFSQRRFVTLLILYNCTNLLFFTTTFQVLFKTFKIWLGLIARFNFSRNTQTKIKTHLQRKPIYFHQGFRYLQHLPALQDAFPPSAIFRPIIISNLLFANSCRSWCCLMYHHSRICQTHFSKKFKKNSERCVPSPVSFNFIFQIILSLKYFTSVPTNYCSKHCKKNKNTQQDSINTIKNEFIDDKKRGRW